jgi:hypothetical protein
VSILALALGASGQDKDAHMTLSPGEYTLKVNGLDLWYKVTGKGPVLMVQPPGWGIGVGLYEQTFRPMESEFTLIYYNTRGSGRSQAPPNADDINVGAFVEDLEAAGLSMNDRENLYPRTQRANPPLQPTAARTRSRLFWVVVPCARGG